MKRRALHIAVLILALLSFAPQAWACNCAQPQTPKRGFDTATAVFTAEVTDVVDKHGRFNRIVNEIRVWLGQRPRLDWRNHGYRVTLRVLHSWKGMTSDVVTVSTGYGDGDCGFHFSTGAEYLIYADGEDMDNLNVGSCSRTSELPLAAEDMRFLSTLTKLPLRAASGPANRWFLPLILVVSVFVLAALFREFRLRARRAGKSGTDPN